MPKILVEKYRAIPNFPDPSGRFGMVRVFDRCPASGFAKRKIRAAGEINRPDQKKGG
jgi:hypothetical protein